MIIDTHAHLNMHQFDKDLDAVLANAKAHGVGKMIVIGMDKYHNQRALFLAEKYDNLYAAIGVHPVDVDKLSVDDILPYLEKDKVVAVGETGIDLYWHKDNLEKQKAYFIKQIELAIQYDLPIIIHTRNSFDEAYDCVKPYKGKLRGVFHSFSSGLKEAKMVIDLGLYIGISGVITFPKAVELKEIVKEVPLEHLLLETDAPFLTPAPYRGQRNEPGYTFYVAREVASIKAIDIETVKKVTTENANKLFRLETQL